MYGAKKPKLYLSLDEARKRKFKPDFTGKNIIKPSFIGVKNFDNYPLSELRPYIDWTFFFLAWEFRGKYPAILNDPKQGEQARLLLSEANAFLDEIIENKLIQAKGVLGIWPANSSGDDIELYADEQRDSIIGKFHHLRQQQAKEEGSPQYCLADFIAPKSENIADYCGAFAVTAGIGVAELVAQYKADNNDYKAIMLEALADRLAEAFAEKLHEEVRRNYWGYTKEENLSKEQLISVKYQGIRPAAGYPACPEHSEKAEIFRLLNAEKNTGITLTEHYSMYPTAAVSGQYFAHPQAVYFGIEKVGRDQVEDYARRKDVAQQFVEKFIPANLNYK